MSEAKPAPLPPPCDLCRPHDGAWAMGSTGLKRCTCPRGQALQAADRLRQERTRVKAQKEAEQAAVVKKQERERWLARRRADQRLAERYREMPLIDTLETHDQGNRA